MSSGCSSIHVLLAATLALGSVRDVLVGEDLDQPRVVDLEHEPSVEDRRVLLA